MPQVKAFSILGKEKQEHLKLAIIGSQESSGTKLQFYSLTGVDVNLGSGTC